MEFLKKHFRSPFVGFVDTRRIGTISGWARNLRTDMPVTVDFVVDGRSIGGTVADRYRADLLSQCPHGRCAFEYTLPEHYRDGAEHTVEVRARGATKPLTNGQFILRQFPAKLSYGMVRAILSRGLWALAGTVSHDTVYIAGWYIPPPDHRDHRITINGQPVTLQLKEGAEDWKSPLPSEFTSYSFVGVVARKRA